ncbi:MAG: hypothetical protein WCP58_08190 [bacterium]
MQTSTIPATITSRELDFYAIGQKYMATIEAQEMVDFIEEAEEAEHGTTEQQARWAAEDELAQQPKTRQLSPSEFEALFGA